MAEGTLLTVEDYRAFPFVPPDFREQYGEVSVQQFGDLYVPDDAVHPEPFPVLMMIHGGCWRDGFGLDFIGQFCHALTEQGFAVWSIEYRRLASGALELDEADAFYEQGGWPNTFLDVGEAADELRELADEFPLDISHVTAIGHSAGGHLAAWLAARKNISPESPLYMADPLPIHGVISLAGIPDLAEGVRHNICGEAIPELMGGLLDAVPERYAAGSPAELLPLGVPQVLITGAEDGTVPVDYVAAYAQKAQNAGDSVSVVNVASAAHFEVVWPEGDAWREVLAAVRMLRQGHVVAGLTTRQIAERDRRENRAYARYQT